MFSSIAAKLFSGDKSAAANYIDASDDSPAPKNKTQKPAPASRHSAMEAPSAIELLEQRYGQVTDAEIKSAGKLLDRKDFLFYEYLLGKSKSVNEVNPLERKILIDTNKLMERPEVILKLLPQLPQSVIKLRDMLGSKDFVIKDFVEVVEQEPALASHMIKIANSPMYNLSGKEISSLNHAFMLIGANGVREHVLMRFFKQILNIKPIYFRMFGEKIWDHCLSTAIVAKKLAQKTGQDQDSAYLIGLLHDIGKIMIFQVMVNAFRQAQPDESPNSLVFKKLLNDKSMQISMMIIKEWHMPSRVTEAVNDLCMGKQRQPSTHLGKILRDANLVSELGMMASIKKFEPGQYLQLCKQAQMEKTAIELLFHSIFPVERAC